MARIAISYVGDLATASESALLVDGDFSYIAACHTIAEYCQTARDTEIWVRNKGHLAWLRSFINQLSIEADFSETTPRTLLAQKWETAIPDWVTDEAITSQGLLGIDMDGKAGTSFNDRLLGKLLDPACAVEAINSDNAASIITTLAGDHYREVAAKYPLVQECAKKKAEEWRQNGSEKWIAPVCEHLPEKALVSLRWFGAWSLLKNYPDELLERVIPFGQVVAVRSIPAEVVEKVSLEPSVREEALTQIELHLTGAAPLVKTNADYRKFVACMSGRLTEEFQFALNLLEKGNIDPQVEDITLVQRTFDACPGILRSRVQALKHLVRPPYPTLIGKSEEWTADRWVRWTLEEYSPYREWQVRNGKFDPALESSVARFSDWYIDSYLTIHADVNLGLTYCLNSLNDSKKRRGLSIVLVVDCLPISYVSLMDDALWSVGFKQQSQEYRYSSLPTVTEYNKAVLISSNAAKVSNDYSSLLSERSIRDWGEIKTDYIGSLKALADFLPGSDTEIVVVNYTEGDEILHSDIESKNRTYEDELSRVFEQLAEAVIGVCERWSGPREDIRVLLVTDHGACRILGEETKTFSSNVLNKLFEEEKHRVATMPSDQATKVPSNLWDLGYQFRSPYSKMDVVHFLPRGHNTVRRAGTNRGYVHGGVTPEEVIVPTALYGLIATIWKRPAIRFINIDMKTKLPLVRFFIQRIVGIEIEVQNPNSLPLQVTAIEVLAPEASTKDVRVATVGPASVAKIHIDLYFQKSALGADALELRLRYQIGGAEQELALSLAAEFRSATAPGLNLRDL